MLKFFGYKKGVNHLHITQTLYTISLVFKALNLFCGGFFKLFLINLKTQRFIIQANGETGYLVMQYQKPFDVSFCDSASQFISFLVRDHPEEFLESCFLAFILLKLQVFHTVFSPLHLKNNKHYLFFSMQLFELCKASTVNLFFLFFFFSFQFFAY